MAETQPNTRRFPSDQWIAVVFSVPWLEVLAGVYRLARKLWQGLADEGMYEVLSYETTLELKDKQGTNAQFSKRQKVKYLQNNIIAYQDHAWGGWGNFTKLHLYTGRCC